MDESTTFEDSIEGHLKNTSQPDEGAIFVGLGLFFTAISIIADTRGKYLQTINVFHNDINPTEESQERNEVYEVFGIKYLNLLDQYHI